MKRLPEYFVAISPTGDITFADSKELSILCEHNKLNKQEMRKCAKGTALSHLGWKCYFKECSPYKYLYCVIK